MESLNEKLKRRLSKSKPISINEVVERSPIVEPLPPNIEPNVKVDLNFDYAEESEVKDGIPDQAPIKKEDLAPLYEILTRVREKIQTLKEEQETLSILLQGVMKAGDELKVKREVLEADMYQIQKGLFDLLRD